jgi:hypothetical protein
VVKVKPKNIILLLLLMVSISSVTLSSTFARFSGEYKGSDFALVAKWNFGARGEDDIEGEFYNKGFTFDLFKSHSVKPMDFGAKSFIFTGGGSDTAIVYDVEMSIKDLLWLTTGTVARRPDVDIYAPFIFKITATINDGATDTQPTVFSHNSVCGDGWFRAADVQTDDEGFFSIFDHSKGGLYFSPGSLDTVTVTVYWQWNTSCFINDVEASWVEPNTSTEIKKDYLPYYQEAYDQYYRPGGLDDNRKAASQAVIDFLKENSSQLEDGSWVQSVPCELSDSQHREEYDLLSPGEQENYLIQHGGSIDEDTGEIIWAPHEVAWTDEIIAQYNQLAAAEAAAIEACRTSLLAAYDDYDTLAVDALLAKDSVKVIFRIKGEQVEPD